MVRTGWHPVLTDCSQAAHRLAAEPEPGAPGAQSEPCQCQRLDDGMLGGMLMPVMVHDLDPTKNVLRPELVTPVQAVFTRVPGGYPDTILYPGQTTFVFRVVFRLLFG